MALPGKGEALPGKERRCPGKGEALPGKGEALPGSQAGRGSAAGQGRGAAGQGREALLGKGEALPGKGDALLGKGEALLGKETALQTKVSTWWDNRASAPRHRHQGPVSAKICVSLSNPPPPESPHSVTRQLPGVKVAGTATRRAGGRVRRFTTSSSADPHHAPGERPISTGEQPHLDGRDGLGLPGETLVAVTKLRGLIADLRARR